MRKRTTPSIAERRARPDKPTPIDGLPFELFKKDGRVKVRNRGPVGTPWHEIDLGESIVFRDDALAGEAPRPVTPKRWVLLIGLVLGAGLAVGFGWLGASKVDDWGATIRGALDDLAVNDIPYAKTLRSNPNIFGELMTNMSTLFSPHRKSWVEEKDFTVGKRLDLEGVRAEFPIYLIPGIVSTGLESWSSSTECGKPYFRKRLWGTTTMMRTLLVDKECWVAHLMLDPETGLDHGPYKMRAAQGLEAADRFLGPYWIWEKVIQSLAAIGSDSNNLHMAAYDWRLTNQNLEKRDKFFSRLKASIELHLQLDGKKSILASHSMGGQVALYFLKWVEAESGGGGGRDWVDRHIEAFINIAGTMLGVPKAISALLSGEMKDTVELNALAVYMLERFFSRRERAELFRTWGGSASMLLKGGEDVWGNLTVAPDDKPDQGTSFGQLLSFRQDRSAEGQDFYIQDNLTISQTMNYMLEHTPKTFHQM